MKYTFTTTKTVDTASIVISDDSARKTVTARVAGFPMPIALWTGQDYDAAGDYTQAQAELRLAEILAADMRLNLKPQSDS